jgi:hypothetical protein
MQQSNALLRQLIKLTRSVRSVLIGYVCAACAYNILWFVARLDLTKNDRCRGVKVMIGPVLAGVKLLMVLWVCYGLWRTAVSMRWVVLEQVKKARARARKKENSSYRL